MFDSGMAVGVLGIGAERGGIFDGSKVDGKASLLSCVFLFFAVMVR